MDTNTPGEPNLPIENSPGTTAQPENDVRFVSGGTGGANVPELRTDEHDRHAPNIPVMLEQPAIKTASITDAPLHAPVALRPNDPAANDIAVEQAIHRMSRRSFLWGAAALAGTYGLWRGINAQRQIDGIAWPFRLALQANENLARDYFKTARLSPTFAREQIGRLPLNGTYGADPTDDFDSANWKLHVVGLASDEEGAEGERAFTLAQIKKLPRVEMITELKCIEGWSSIVQWAGVRLADFIAKYPPAKIEDAMPQYVGMKTPDEGYYVGLDMESALHPQTLLCYEMNGKPLTYEHGAPLRLVIPHKYGIKNIKRIGTITFTNDRPKDYWAERGYDWYAGH